MMWILIELGNRLQRIKIFQPKRCLGYYELEKHKPWFDEGCSKLWLQYPSEINGDNLNNTRCEASRKFGNEMQEYLKDKINELATNSKNKNIGEFRRGYQPRSNLVMDETGYLLANSHNNLSRLNKYFSQLLNEEECI
jgi:hypothetical protein